MPDTTRLTVEWVPIDRVYLSPANPRRNEAAVPRVAASLRRFGWQQPIVARADGEVIAGNTRLKAATELGMAEVPVAWFEGSDLDAMAFQVADNRTSEFAEWDEPGLAKILEQLRLEDGLDGVGFDEGDLDALLAELEEERDELADPGPQELPVVPVTAPGDLWLLGDHRLLCGDSTDPGEVARLMNGQTARLLATDPPYLVDYDESADQWDAFTGDEAGIKFFEDYLRIGLEHVHETAPVYQWHASRRQVLVEQAWSRLGLLLHQTIVWVKTRGVLTRSHFMWQSEPCFYGWRKGKQPAKHRRPPHSTTNVWAIDSEREGTHPTQKPRDVFRWPIKWHTRVGEVCYEPFSGSGTQIIAAEELGRRCFAMELSPGYCDAAVKRWEASTGKRARTESGKELL